MSKALAESPIGGGVSAAVDIVGVSKSYGSFKALDNVSLQIPPGEFFGLLGPNGAGKTTLISILAGLTRASAGVVRVNGFDVVDDYRRARQSLGVVPQELVFDPFFDVRETLRITSGYYGIRDNDAWIDEILENLGLTAQANTNMRALSGGMKRRVLIAQALVHRPPVIVLDEPTAGVDVELRQTLWRFIRSLNAKGHTIVLTTHYLEEAQELCSRVGMLKGGQMVALESTASLLDRFSAGRLNLRLSGAALPASLDELLIESNDDRYVLSLERYELLEQILGKLRAAGCVIQEMELTRADLEDVFVRIMGGDDSGQSAGIYAKS